MSNMIQNWLRGFKYHKIIGCLKTLPSNMLPSLGNVLRNILTLEQRDEPSKNQEWRTLMEVLSTPVKVIKSIWIKASITPIISEKSIFNQIKEPFINTDNKKSNAIKINSKQD